MRGHFTDGSEAEALQSASIEDFKVFYRTSISNSFPIVAN